MRCTGGAGQELTDAGNSRPMSEEHDIRVQVSSAYVAEQSETESHRYVFSYTVTIVNQGTRPAQLVSRHWIVTDADGNEQEVRGEGVVGEQPTLRPGEGFRYTSGAVLETPVGSMRGSYQLVDDKGRQFDTPIAPFTLAVPGALH
jgi:ApaG protein